MRKLAIILLSLCLCFSAMGALNAIDVKAQTEKMMEFSVDLNKITFEDPTHRVYSVLAPFNSKGYGYTNFSITDGSTLSYEFYSSEVVSGVGGVELQVKYNDKKGTTKYTYISNKLNEKGVKDGNGKGVSLFEDLTKEIGNGWYKREIKINYSDIEENINSLQLEHFFVAFCSTIAEINELKEVNNNVNKRNERLRNWLITVIILMAVGLSTLTIFLVLEMKKPPQIEVKTVEIEKPVYKYIKR